MAGESYSISKLAKEFKISSRTIRFYEEKGLLAPAKRAGGQRIFSRQDRARLKLILRGKRFGLSLDEIVTILGPPLGPSEKPIHEKEQIRSALQYGMKYLEKITVQISDLKLIEKEMHEHSDNCVKRLLQLGCGEDEIEEYFSPLKEDHRHDTDARI